MSNDHEPDAGPLYKVVLNHEEQYSIWPAEKEPPAGWAEAGFRGAQEECLAHIKEVWVDMRPLSLRTRPPEPADEGAAQPDAEGEEPTLVERLSDGTHAVEFSSRAETSAAALKERIESGFVRLRFPGTRGGTELSIKLDPQDSDFSGADFEGASGEVRVVGTLSLDGTRVKCVARLDLNTLKGTGSLQPLS